MFFKHPAIPKHMLYNKKPANFNPDFEIASGYLMYKGKLLVLKRNDDDDQGGKWGMPGGKIEKGETIKEALFREIREETGIILKEDDVVYLKKLYVKYPGYDFIYHMFYAKLSGKPDVIIDLKEHSGYKWVLPQDIAGLDMVLYGKKCVRLFMDMHN